MNDMESTMKKQEGTRLETDFYKKPMGYDLKLGQRVEDQMNPCGRPNGQIRMNYGEWPK